MDEIPLDDRYVLSDYITGPRKDFYWVSPVSVDEELEYLVELPDTYDTVDDECRIADIGCGDGALTVALADRYPEADVNGIDISPRYAQKAARSYRKETGQDNVSIIGGDAYEILPELKPYDFLFAVNVFQDTAEFSSAVETVTDAARGDAYIGATFTGEGAKHLFEDRIVYDEETDAEYWEFEDVVLDEETTVSFYQRIIPESEAVGTFEEHGFEPVEETELSADNRDLEGALRLLDPENDIDITGLDPTYPFYLFHRGDDP